MANKTLSAVFKAVDQMSATMDRMANGGTKMAKVYEAAGGTANKAFSSVANGSDRAAQSIAKNDTVAQKCARSQEDLARKVGSASRAEQEAANQADLATRAINSNSSAAEKAAKELGGMADELENVAKGLDDVNNSPAVNNTPTNRPNRPSGATPDSIPTKPFDDAAESVGALESALATAGIAISLAAIGAAFMEAGRAASEFETRMAAIATVADQSQASIGQITSDILALSQSTGQSVIELGQATYEAISASVDTASAVGFVADANKLAVGGFTTAANATDILTTSINAYGLEAADATRISDILITTQNLGKTVVDELAQSMGRVIPTAAAFNVEMDNLSTAFAITTSNGIKTAEAGTYINQMLVELGMASSNVSAALTEETGMAFAQLMEQGNSLGGVLQIVKDSVDGDTTAFRNMWGSATAGAAALSLLQGGSEKFNTTLGTIQNSAGATSKAYDIMANTTEFAAKKAANSFENLKIAVGTGFNSLMSPIYEVSAGVMDAFSGFLTEYPAVSKAFTGIAAGAGIAAVAITGYTVATNIAKLATDAFKASISTIFWPIMAVSALVSGVVLLCDTFDRTVDEYDTLTAASRGMHDELASLNSQYDKSVAKLGETDKATLALRYEIDQLNATYEKSKQSLEEFAEEVYATAEAEREAKSSFNDRIESLHDEELSTMALIYKLEELGNKSVQTAGDQALMLGVANELVTTYPEFADVIDTVTGKFKASAVGAREYAKAVIEAQKQQAKMEELMRLIGQEDKLESAYNVAKANLDSYQSFYDTAYSKMTDMLSKGINYGPEYNQAADAVNHFNDMVNATSAAFAEAEVAYKSNQTGIENLSAELDGYAASAAAAAESQDAMTLGQIAANDAMSGVAEMVTAAATAYDQAYSSIKSNLSSAFGLMEEVNLKSDVTAAGLAKSWGEQATAVAEYEANLLRASQIGLSDDVVARFSDGSKDSMANIKALVDDMEGITAKGGDVSGSISNINSSYAGLNDRIDKSAQTAADFASGYSKAMEEAERATKETIEGMTLPGDAYTAAETTMNGYILAISNAKSGAKKAAQSVADAVQAVFDGMKLPAIGGAGAGAGAANKDNNGVEAEKKNGGTGGKTRQSAIGIAGNAFGTTNAEDVFMAGELGPELIIGRAGSTVFPTSETDRIISAVAGREFNVQPQSGFGKSAESAPIIAMPTQKGKNSAITINLQGGGKISVPRGTRKKDVLKIMQDNMKPVLMGMLEDEMFEEGDGTYDY